jgi:hypothetical protein
MTWIAWGVDVSDDPEHVDDCGCPECADVSRPAAAPAGPPPDAGY